MPVPFLGNAMKGWTYPKYVTFVTKNVVDFEVVEDIVTEQVDMNLQPIPANELERLPEEQREWSWWSLIITGGPALSMDDKITVDDITYRVVRRSNWSQSGFKKYKCVEDYNGR